LLRALKRISVKLNQTDIDWVLTGSTGFYIRGMRADVNDIDIQSDRLGIERIQDLFKEHMVRNIQFSGTDLIRSYFGEARLEGTKIEFMGDIQRRMSEGTWSKPISIKDHRQFIAFQDMYLPVLDLQYEYRAYLELGRIEKAQHILAWIERK
jgi:hypothetical protein